MSSLLSRVFYFPGDWLADNTSVRTRRAIAAWTLILAGASFPLTYPLRASVAVVWGLSEIALILGAFGWVGGETPTENESGS